jgi:hypothetical protein
VTADTRTVVVPYWMTRGVVGHLRWQAVHHDRLDMTGVTIAFRLRGFAPSGA